MIIVFCIVLAVVLTWTFYLLKGGKFQDTESSSRYNGIEPEKSRFRYASEIALTYGPLSVVEAEELAWPPKQFISIKKSDDRYARWAEVEEITDEKIRYIGRAVDCWLCIDGPNVSGVRPYHLGIVKSRGSYFVFKLDAQQEVFGPDYDWWNRTYSRLENSEKFKVGTIKLVFYRNTKPVTIEGRNTNGIAIINTEGEGSPVDQSGTIGSAPDCWITLPDPELPDYVAVRRGLGHHKLLYEYGASLEGDYLTRADRECHVGGYHIVFK